MTNFLADERANKDYAIIDHYDGQFQEIYEKRVNADYIFIGTSHVTHGVTPQEFEKSGKKFFNFALNGATPSYYVWWYNDVFKANYYPKPKAIVIGVDWFMFDSDWLWRRPEFDSKYLRPNSTISSSMSMYKGKWYDISAAVTYVTNRFAVFSSRNRFIDLVYPEKKEPQPKVEILTKDGFRLDLFYKGFVPYQAEYDGTSVGDVKTNYNPDEKAAFLSLIDEFQSELIPLVFVMTPEYLPGRNAPQFDSMVDIIVGIAADKGIPFLNYNTDLVSDINYDYTNYSDWGHLDNKGAHIFSQKLYSDLNKILLFAK